MKAETSDHESVLTLQRHALTLDLGEALLVSINLLNAQKCFTSSFHLEALDAVLHAAPTSSQGRTARPLIIFIL